MGRVMLSSRAHTRTRERAKIDPANPANPAAPYLTCGNAAFQDQLKPRFAGPQTPPTPQAAGFAGFSFQGRSAKPRKPVPILTWAFMAAAGFAGFAGLFSRAHVR